MNSFLQHLQLWRGQNIESSFLCFLFLFFYFLVYGSVIRTLKHSKIMEALRKPAPLSFEGNVAENWRTFESEFDIFVEAWQARMPLKKLKRSHMLLR